MVVHLFHEHHAEDIPLVFVGAHYLNGQVMSVRRREDIDAAGLQGRPGPVRVQAAAGGIALFTPSAWPAPHAPRLVIAVEKEGPLDIHHHIVELIHDPDPFLPMAVQQDRLLIRVQDAAHLLRAWGVWRTTEAPAVGEASELALEPHPGGGNNASGLDYQRVIGASFPGHPEVRR